MLKSFNESNSVIDDEIDNIKEILQSWIDEFNFDILKHHESDNWSGVFYHVDKHKNGFDIIFNINNITQYWKEYNEIKNRITELVDHLRLNYDDVYYHNPSRYVVSTEQRELEISIII